MEKLPLSFWKDVVRLQRGRNKHELKLEIMALYKTCAEADELYRNARHERDAYASVLADVRSALGVPDDVEIVHYVRELRGASTTINQLAREANQLLSVANSLAAKRAERLDGGE